MNGFLKDITYARSGEYILSIYTRESCKDLWKNFGERPNTFSIAKKADPRGPIPPTRRKNRRILFTLQNTRA